MCGFHTQNRKKMWNQFHHLSIMNSSPISVKVSALKHTKQPFCWKHRSLSYTKSEYFCQGQFFLFWLTAAFWIRLRFFISPIAWILSERWDAGNWTWYFLHAKQKLSHCATAPHPCALMVHSQSRDIIITSFLKIKFLPGQCFSIIYFSLNWGVLTFAWTLEPLESCRFVIKLLCKCDLASYDKIMTCNRSSAELLNILSCYCNSFTTQSLLCWNMN